MHSHQHPEIDACTGIFDVVCMQIVTNIGGISRTEPPILWAGSIWPNGLFSESLKATVSLAVLDDISSCLLTLAKTIENRVVFVVGQQR